MKIIIATVVLGIVSLQANAAGLNAAAQTTSTGHSAVLTWAASPDGGTVNVYRASTACSASASFTQIQTGVVAAGPYTDSTIGIGSWCYQVTAVVNGSESASSNQITLQVRPSPPSGLAGSSN